MFELNGTYVIFMVLFLIFVQLLNMIMIKPAGIAIEKRAKHIQENLAAAKNFSQETDKILSDYQAKLHASRLEAQAVIQEALVQAQKQRDEKLKNIQSEGRSKIDELKAEFASTRENLLQSLIHPELELVRNIINKLLGETPALVTDEERVFQVLKETH